jgi:hypothetical protein
MKFPIRTLAVAVAAATMVPTLNVLAQEETLTEDVLRLTHPLLSMSSAVRP